MSADQDQKIGPRMNAKYANQMKKDSVISCSSRLGLKLPITKLLDYQITQLPNYSITKLLNYQIFFDSRLSR